MLGARIIAAGAFVAASALLSACSPSNAPHQPSPTSFGATISARPGESVDDARTRIADEVGRPPIVRLYSRSMPPPWAELLRSAGDADIVVSFKIDPEVVVNGGADTQLTEWFEDAPTDRDVYWIYYHEPEDNIEDGEFTSNEFRSAWRHVDLLASDVQDGRLFSTLVLMCWSLRESSGRAWRDYLPADAKPDVLAWDCYNRQAASGGYTPPDQLFDATVKASGDVGSRWAVAEFGSELAVGDDDGSRRARWLWGVANYARANDAVFVTYFHALVDGAYALSDSASQRAWRRIMSGRRPGFAKVADVSGSRS